MDRLAFNDRLWKHGRKLVKQARPTTFHGGADRVGWLPQCLDFKRTLNAVMDHATAYLVPCALYPVSLEDSR